MHFQCISTGVLSELWWNNVEINNQIVAHLWLTAAAEDEKNAHTLTRVLVSPDVKTLTRCQIVLSCAERGLEQKQEQLH